MRLNLMLFIFLTSIGAFAQGSLPLQRLKLREAIQLEKELASKAIFCDEQRDKWHCNLMDINNLQLIKYSDTIFFGKRGNFFIASVQRTNEKFQPATTLHYIFSEKDSNMVGSIIEWRIQNNHNTYFVSRNWINDFMRDMKQQRKRIEDYDRQFNSVFQSISKILGPTLYVDKERITKVDNEVRSSTWESGIKYWERKAIWDTKEIQIEQKMIFFQDVDISGWSRHEIILKINYRD